MINDKENIKQEKVNKQSWWKKLLLSVLIILTSIISIISGCICGVIYPLFIHPLLIGINLFILCWAILLIDFIFLYFVNIIFLKKVFKISYNTVLLKILIPTVYILVPFLISCYLGWKDANEFASRLYAP